LGGASHTRTGGQRLSKLCISIEFDSDPGKICRLISNRNLVDVDNGQVQIQNQIDPTEWSIVPVAVTHPTTTVDIVEFGFA
jgi:hypothetical protein